MDLGAYPHMGRGAKKVDAEIRRLADGQSGFVTRRQLIANEASADAVRHRVRNGTLIRRHYGVYRAGHEAPSTITEYLSAVLASGDGSLLSGPSAAFHLEIMGGPAPSPEVTAPTERRVPGVRTRRARRTARAGMTWKGVPVTTPAETIVDLAATFSLDDLARAFHKANIKHGTTPKEVATVLERRPNAPGVRKVKRIIFGDFHLTLSEMERRFLRLLKRNGLPLPQTNVPVGQAFLDCRWPQADLTVELDSYRFHNSRHSWEKGHQRERDARLRGDEFRRFTWTDVAEDQRYLIGQLTSLLRRPLS